MAIKKFKVEASKEAKTDGKAKKPVKANATKTNKNTASRSRTVVKASAAAKRRAKAIKASNGRKWVNTELSKSEWEQLRKYLKEKGYKYESSQAGDDIHVECYLNDAEIEEVDAFIDTLTPVASGCGKKKVKSSKRLVKASASTKRRSAKRSVKADRTIHDAISEFQRLKDIINDFCDREYGDSADFSNSKDVALGYTTYGDGEDWQLQCTADLENFKLIYTVTYPDGTYAEKVEDYGSAAKLAEALEDVTFDSLMSLEYFPDLEEDLYSDYASDNNVVSSVKRSRRSAVKASDGNQNDLQSYGNSIKSEIQSIANKSGYIAPYSPSVGNTDIFFDGHYESVPVVVFELNEQYGKNADVKKLTRTLKKFFKGTGYDCFVQDTTRKPLGTKDLVIYKSYANDASVKASRRITASTDDDTLVMYWDGNKVFEGEVGDDMWREITWFLDEPEHMQDIVDYCNSFGDPLITDTSTSLENIRDIAKTFVDLVAKEIAEAAYLGNDVYISDEAGHFEIFKKSMETSDPWKEDVTSAMSNKNRTDYKSNPIYELDNYVKQLAEGVIANIDGISYEITDEAISFFITNGEVVFVQPIDDITPEPDDLPVDIDALTSAVLAELDDFDKYFASQYEDDPDFATRAVQMSTSEDELEPIMGEEPEDLGYGFDSNGEAIDESTIEALYHMAEYEILPNTELGKIDQYASIDEDSWDYYFGGFTNTGMLGVVKFYIHFHLTDETINLNEYALPEATMFPNFQYYTAKLDFDIYTENGEVKDIIFEGAEIREVKDNVYSKQYSEGFEKYYNVEAIKNYIETIATPSVEDIYSSVINL